MRPQIRRLLLAAAIALGVNPPAGAAEAGMRSMLVPGPEPILVALFYPSSSPAKTLSMGPFRPTVAHTGATDLPVRGLVLLSHGTSGSEIGHHDLAARLAREGYVVAALRHPGDNWQQGRGMAAESRYFTERPRQASRVIDALLADPLWGPRIPRERIAALGHSAGGYTVLALAGGRADSARIAAHCRATQDDATFCQLGKAALDAPPSGTAAPLADVTDARVRAVIAMAPVGLVLDPASLGGIRVPVAIYTASLDTVLVPKYHADPLMRAMPQATHRRVEGAGHFAFMSQPGHPLPSQSGDAAGNPPGFDRQAFLDKLAEEIVAFLDAALR